MRFSTMTEMAVAFPAFTREEAAVVWHRAFCFWQQEYNGNEFACWAAIQVYKMRPSKRQATFIGQHWARKSEDKAGESRDMSILAPVNPGSGGQNWSPEALRERVEQIAEVKGWMGKLAHKGEVATMGATPPDLFAGLEGAVNTNFFDILLRTPFNSDRDIQPSAHYAVSLRNDLPKMTAAGFYPPMMGLW